MKRTLLAAALLCCGFIAKAQTTLEECISLGYSNYPQIKEMDLVDKTRDFELAAASTAWLPQLSLSGKATWQSEVVEMPFDIPGMEFDIPHDQYSIVAEVSQQLWDGGATRVKKELSQSSAEVKKDQLEVNLYSIRSRVENVYLGIILIDKQLELSDLLISSLNRQLEELKAYKDNGMALGSDLDQLKVSIMSTLQQKKGLEADRKSYVKVLSLLTGRDMTSESFLAPSFDLSATDPDFSLRPEMALYSSQLKRNEVQLKQLNAALSPKFNLSLQTGYGRPGMNMLSGEFSPYLVAGVKMQWNIAALYTRGNDKKKLSAEASRIELTRQSFLLNSRIEAEQKSNAILKARDVLEDDTEIVALRESITRTGERQYREGTLKMNDYLSMLDEEYKARLNQSLHEVQLMMAICEYKNTTVEK